MEQSRIGETIQKLAERNRPDLLKKSDGLVNQSALAAEAGIQQATLSRIMKGEHKSPQDKNIRPIARALRTSPAEVRGEVPIGSSEGIGNTIAGPDNVRAAPLISWVQAGSWAEIVDNYQPGDAERLVYTTKKVGPRAFALRVRGDSMENPRGRPSYPEGAIIIVDPDKAAASGSRVVVRLEENEEATFKVFVEDAGRRFLKPLNPQYPTLELSTHATLCGVVVQTIIEED